MSSLIRDRQIVEDDYTLLDDDAPLPPSGYVIVSLARWQRDAASLRATALNVGVRIPNTLDVTTVWTELAERPLLNLEFPAFGDGRAYSQARLLRDRYAYAGEIRASGAAVVRDQIHGMHRCGINSFELRADQDAHQCLTAFDDFRAAYQPAADQRLTVAHVRSQAQATDGDRAKHAKA
jgi:uncharacterized protein (DUF934 family)